ncbi:MAG: HAD family hydrolase [Ktedonobacteraceae bacterium]
MRQYLLLDADDTLWENNIYFEQATHDFITFLNHSHLSRAEVQVVIDEAERLMGYGSANFTKSLVETYHHLAEKDIRDEDIQQVQRFGEQIRSHPIQFLDGVSATLDYLSVRHTLFLLTKGDLEEQQFKVEQSGIELLFQQVLVVQEKDVNTYQRIVNQLQLNPREAWMIGNSPRSDINPALAAGLNAVYIPHPHTWHLEHEEVIPAAEGQFLQLASFTELRNHF